jgi:hypothetical protein
MQQSYNNMDDILRSSLQNDKLEVCPNPAIEQRVQYHYLLKNSSARVRSNSFVGFASWIFSLQGLGIKTSLAVICMVVMLFGGSFHQSSNRNLLTDTSLVAPALIDSNYLVKDTLLR